MDPSRVPSQVHQNDEQQHLHSQQQVKPGAEDEAHRSDHEKSVMNRVKAKARKIKDSIKKHYGHNNEHTPVHDRDHLDDDDDEEEEEESDKDVFQDPQVHEAPINEREVVKTASEQVETIDKPVNDFEFQGTKVMREEQPHQDSLVDSISSTTEINQKIQDIATTDPAKTFIAENKPEILEEVPHEIGSRPEEYTLPDYQTKVTDSSGAGSVEEPHYNPLVEDVNSTTEINQNIATDPTKTFAVEEKPEHNKFNLEKPIVLEENPEEQGSRPEAYTHPNYQTKITDASGDGSDGIKEITEVGESFERLNVRDEITVTDTEYPPAKNHDQFVPHLSFATKTQNEHPHDESLSTDIIRNQEIPSETRETFNTITNFNSEAVEKSATPDSEQVEYLGKSGIDFEGTKSEGDEHHRNPVAEDVSSTAEIEQNPKEYKVNLEKPIALQEGPNEQGSRPKEYDLPNYQTEVTNPRRAGSDEIKGNTTIEESFERLNVNNEPSVVADSEYLPAKSDDQFAPHLSAATKTQSEYPHDETLSTDINTNPEIPSETREPFNNITTTDEEKQPLNESVETQSVHKSYTDETEIPPATVDETYSLENHEASRLGYDEKGYTNKKTETHDEQEETENASNKYGTSIGSGGVEVETETKSGVKDHQDKGVPVKDYLAEKLRPGEEDKALSEIISEALHKPKEEPVKKEQGELGSEDEKPEKASEESYLNKVKGVVGSWFAKSEETQSPHGGEDLSKTKNSVADVERVGQVVDEPRKKE